MKVISNLDLRGHQLVNVIAENLPTTMLPAASSNKGRFIYDTTKNDLYFSNGTEWVSASKSKISYVSNGVISVDGTNLTVFSIAATGDVTINASGELLIGTNKVTNAHLAKAGAKTLKGNKGSDPANVSDLTVEEVLAMLGIDLTSLNSKVSDVKVDGVSVVTANVANIPLSTRLSEFKTSLKIGQAEGLATLGTDGKIPQSQLPSYVDDVLEYASLSAFPSPGESGKIYVDLATNKTYRWGGTQYTEISASIVIGTTSGTAADGAIAQSHYNNSEIHITASERTTWNAKQSTNVSVEAVTEGEVYFPESKTTKTVKEWIQSLWNSLYNFLKKFESHTHNGTDSPKIDYSSILNTPYTPKVYKSGALTGSSGTIPSSTHGCGTKVLVQAFLAGDEVMCDINIADNGDVKWTAAETFTAESKFMLVIHG